MYQPFNTIAMHCHWQYLLDDEPSCCFLPALSFSEVLNWDGEDYEAIFMGSEAEVVQSVGAIHGDLLECSGDDERVQRAFSGFRDATATVLGLLKARGSSGQYKPERYDSDDDLLSHSLGEYLAEPTTAAFRVPAPDNSSESKYRIVRFSRARALGDTADLAGHPAPIPLLLVATGKSLNAWSSHLLGQKLLDGFALPTGHRADAKHCSIFPPCGADESEATCPVCLARMIVLGDPALDSPEFFEDDDDDEHGCGGIRPYFGEGCQRSVPGARCCAALLWHSTFTSS